MIRRNLKGRGAVAVRLRLPSARWQLRDAILLTLVDSLPAGTEALQYQAVPFRQIVIGENHWRGLGSLQESMPDGR